MSKLEVSEEIIRLYKQSARRVEVVDVPSFNFVKIEGQIEAGKKPATSESFQDALNILYGISFTLKFMSKLHKENPIDYNVMPLEGFWQVPDGDKNFSLKAEWHWSLMMVQPDHISQEMYAEAVSSLRKQRGEIPAINLMSFEPFHEGLSMQILHVGSYELAHMTIGRMTVFAEQSNYRVTGLHHEIHLSDPRRVMPEKARTILRYPIEEIK